MPEIQEQVEDFKKYHLLESDKVAFDDLLRLVVKECLQREDTALKSTHITEHITKKRRKFAWLEE